MNITIQPFAEKDIPEMISIWNCIVEEGNAFPQEEFLTVETGLPFFRNQTLTAIAVSNKEIVGLYILHPNNIGKCSHIANASYAVKKGHRGEKIGEKLVIHSLESAKDRNFRILQFNAVVATNEVALKLYKKIGFIQLGVIPGGFHLKGNEYLDIIPHYIQLK